MGLYAARLWENIAAVHTDWRCTALAPLQEKIGPAPNKYWRNFKDYFVYPLLLQWIRRQGKFDLYHITDHSYAYLLDWIDRRKTIITCHDLIVYKLMAGEISGGNWVTVSTSAITRNAKRIERIRLAAKIIAVSNNTKQDLIRYLGIESERIEVIYPGLNYDFHPLSQVERLQAKAKYGLQHKRLILCVGNNLPYKNLEGVIEASALNLSYYKKNDVVLVKVGSDFSESQKKLITHYGLQDRVIYLGYIPSFERLNELYNIADLFIFPSYYEGFGWPPLEAMACGTPVIASDKGSLKEILADAAMIVDPNDYQQMANAIHECLENEDKKIELQHKGFANIVRFDWYKTAQKTAEIYETVTFEKRLVR